MSFLKATPESPPMFRSRFVDAFSRTHALTVPILYLPTAALLIWHAASLGVGAWRIPVLVVLGFFAWTFLEYWAHRKFFHWIPDNAFGRRMHFIVHGVHHEWPNDKYRLVMPPAVSVTLFFVFWPLFVLTMGNAGHAFMAGFTLGYTYYDTVHYYVHHFAPRTPWLKKLRRHHMIHHFKQQAQHSKFGVSSTLWDHVFGTYEAK